MGYQFTKGDHSVEKGVRRIFCQQIDEALVHAVPEPDGEDIHAMRKQIKKLRALLRLLKPRITDYRALDSALRDAAAQLAPLRDAEVRLGTFDRLVAAPGLPDADTRSEPGTDAVAAVRAVLVADLERLRDPQALAAATGEVCTALKDLRNSLGALKVRGREFGALAEGLGDEWRRSRRAMRKARRGLERDPDPEQFHRWRKSVKRGWYHARLLTPIWPEMMTPHIAAAAQLGDLLGLHNDLAVLVQRLRGPDMKGPLAAPAGALARVAITQQRALARDAVALGARYLADPGKTLTRRWGLWWAVWRG